MPMRIRIICSLHGGEMSLEFLGLLRFFLPPGSDGLPLSEELDSTLSVEVADSPETVFASSEREHGERNRDRQVDADLSALNLVLELSCSVAILGEDGSTVSVGVLIYKINSILESVNAHDNHNGSEDFSVVHFHAWLDVVDDSWTNEVSVGESINLHASSVKEDFSLLVSAFNKLLNSHLRLFSD